MIETAEVDAEDAEGAVVGDSDPRPPPGDRVVVEDQCLDRDREAQRCDGEADASASAPMEARR